jgi:flagellar assembly protein FliH
VASDNDDGVQIERWRAPRMNAADATRTVPRMLTAERIAAIESQAREEGFRQGLDEGRAAGRAERSREAAALRELLDSCTPQTRVLDDQLIEQLSTVVLVSIRQFVRRELGTQPGEVVRIIREAIAVLPASESRITLRLHPDDAALVKDALHPELLERPWRILEELTLSRGGVRIETETSTIDASVEHRLGTLVARLLGDNRGGGAP